MESYIKRIKVNKVRHLHDINIMIDLNKKKNLILTGKNGSGKTSLLEAIRDSFVFQIQAESSLKKLDGKVCLEICGKEFLKEKYQKGEFLVAYYADSRRFETENVEHIEKVKLKTMYEVNENPGSKLAKYLVDLKSTQAFATTQGKEDLAEKIKDWFDKFENLLKEIFSDDGLVLDFDLETFQFHILETDREPFDFNTLSSGYAAILEIVADLMMRVVKRNNYEVEGIVFIDEIETYLHLELQKKILPFLQNMFPNIQFIVTTHSPFVLSSAQNTVIYDLERKVEIEDGLTDLPYEEIVEGYFGVDRMSRELREKFEEYKAIVGKEKFEDSDYEKISVLEMYLDEIADYLAVEITAEYHRLKLELRKKVNR